MRLSPFNKPGFKPPTESPAGGYIPFTETLDVDPKKDFEDIADQIFRGLASEVNHFQFLRTLAYEKRNVDQMIKIASRRMDGLADIYKVLQEKLAFLAKHKVKMRSEEVVQKVVLFLLKEIKDIASDFGAPEFFNVLCKELDTRASQLDDLIASEVEAKFSSDTKK